MINITFPDGSVRSYEQGVTGFQIAESISPALARSVVSCGVNGETVELNRPINEDATIELYKFDDEQGKHTFWHTSAHLLAEAWFNRGLAKIYATHVDEGIEDLSKAGELGLYQAYSVIKKYRDK